jgi:hypothetical protein
VYHRTHDFNCSNFRLILAQSLLELNKHVGGDPPGVILTIRLVQLRYPGQLAAAEQFFRCRLETAKRSQ